MIGQIGGSPEVGAPVHLHTLHIRKATTNLRLSFNLFMYVMQ